MTTNRDSINLGRVITAMVTPFTDNLEMDYKAAADLAKYLVDLGTDGIVVSGTTGEAPVTHREEKMELISVVKQVVDVPVIAGVGSNDTEHTISNAINAAEAGADAVLVVTPYYSRPTQAGLIAHFSAVAQSSKVPVILYDVPSRSGVKIAPETYVELAKNENIVAVKDATGNVYQATKNLRDMNLARSQEGIQNKIQLFSGDDGLLLPFLSVGATGVISVASHLCADKFQKVIEHFDKAEIQEALDVYYQCTDIVDALNGRGAQAVDTKGALKLKGILSNDLLRLPNVGIDKEGIERLQKLI
ncbi:MAG: 4-hydroxy-tetrahydrodipicolinate synthase [Candidatus Ancillula sp.]|jgi:4-hydroxy-tetrahydrodipicolinate synthase|nr:4-hydroxy-tetrahydrodipicolinate synthase [Candidatus Ancillula sp.]